MIKGTIFELDDFELGEGDNDFFLDDIQVAPRVRTKSKPRTQRNKAKTTPKSEPVYTRPLIFPHEILEFVCEHLSQATLRFCASLVSKQWHAVCNRFIRRVGVWEALANDYQDALLAKLPNLNALESWATHDPDVANKRICKADVYITEPLNQPEMMDLILTQCLKIEWVQLELYGTSDQLTMDLRSDHCPTHKSLALHGSEFF
ncbi:hypothetical protein BG006_006269 [Podila minutissima]|uniref:F-box domain-containing protein n=1 Tax=Podila minutissima TaxID=64525 RepID=A0A9P5SUG7_9FUNG|nr:hypothetical protein BG006_006269 [Podila minutissima]